MAVYRIIEVVGQTSEFNIGNVFQTENFTVLKGFDYDILKFFRLLKTAFVADGVLEALVAAFTKLSGSRFDILFGQCTGLTSLGINLYCAITSGFSQIRME